MCGIISVCSRSWCSELLAVPLGHGPAGVGFTPNDSILVQLCSCDETGKYRRIVARRLGRNPLTHSKDGYSALASNLSRVRPVSSSKKESESSVNAEISKRTPAPSSLFEPSWLCWLGFRVEQAGCKKGISIAQPQTRLQIMPHLPLSPSPQESSDGRSRGTRTTDEGHNGNSGACKALPVLVCAWLSGAWRPGLLRVIFEC